MTLLHLSVRTLTLIPERNNLTAKKLPLILSLKTVED